MRRMFTLDHFAFLRKNETKETAVSTKEFLNWFQVIMQQELYRGNVIYLKGIGTFEVRKRKGWKARNPETGEQAIVKDTYKLYFKPSKSMRDWINKNR